jgi:hypothetical protein
MSACSVEQVSPSLPPSSGFYALQALPRSIFGALVLFTSAQSFEAGAEG